MKWLLTVVLFFSLVATGCKALGIEQKQAVQQVYAQELADGRITQAQYDALIAALNGDNNVWIKSLIEIAASIGGSMLAVRAARGPATKTVKVA